MQKKLPHRSYLTTTFTFRCPRCREGKLFRHPVSIRLRRNLEMYDRCPVCGQATDLEVGFYYGTGYVSYVLGLLFTIFTFLIWLLFIGFSFKDHRFMWWLITNAVVLIFLQPWLMRFSRTLWLSWFVSYDPDWPNHPPEEPERIVKEQMNNW